MSLGLSPVERLVLKLICIISVGLLDPPPGFTILELDTARRQLSWSPPFTLDITDEDPDIMGYMICDNVTGSCETVTETQFPYPNLQVPIEFSLSAINVVGEGSAITVVHDPCDPDQGKQ